MCVCVYLAQRFEFGLHDEIELAELAAARIRGLDPLVETRLVHKAQAARAVARHDERTLLVALAVADSAHKTKTTKNQTYVDKKPLSFIGTESAAKKKVATVLMLCYVLPWGFVTLTIFLISHFHFVIWQS